MRTDWTHLEPHRLRKGEYGTNTGDTFGFFLFTDKNRQIRAMAVDGKETGFEHVSVSVKYLNAKGNAVDTMPTWEDMCRMKRLFWEPTEWCVQYHPAEADYVNMKDNVLHIWRYVSEEFPTPRSECV